MNKKRREKQFSTNCPLPKEVKTLNRETVYSFETAKFNFQNLKLRCTSKRYTKIITQM